ncbi:hypothetical protein PT974_05793 [Cladobotryum mycophilum]|uniref:Uncharacterized protein n=1 Tax=Cladobotryum mycophilum TaxID=491253 RepID=A0ABR0SK10_9HYPO
MEALVTPVTSEPKSSIQPRLAVAAGVGAGAAAAVAAGAAYVISKKNEDKKKDEAKAVPRELPTPGQQSKAAEPPKEKAASRPTSTIRLVEPSDSSSAEEDTEQPFAPRPLFSASQKERRSSKRMSARSLTHPRITSSDSGITTISISSDDSHQEDPHQEGGLAPPPKPRVELSPVAEALSTGVTPSATPQPQVHINVNANPTAATNNLMVPPPANPPGQPSPTLGMMPTTTRQPLGASTMSSHNRQTQGKRTMGPRPLEAPGAVRTGSPAVKHVEFAPTEPDDRRHLPSTNLRLSTDYSNPRPLPVPVPRQSMQSNASYQYPQQHIASHQRHPNMNQPAPYQLPPHPSAYRQHPPQHMGHHQQSYYPNRQPPLMNQNQNYNHPPRPQQNRYPHPQHQQPRDQRPPFNPPNLQEQSTFQSQLQEQPGVGGGPYPQLSRLHIPASQQQQQYQQQQQQPPHQPYAHPYANSSPSTTSSAPSLLAKRLGSDRAANMVLPTQQSHPSSKSSKWQRHENEFSPGESGLQQQQQQSQPGDLPATPTWLPKLTPTRRGEDLYLNVQ